MSNIKLTIGINPGHLLDTDGQELAASGEASFNIFLNPFYCMEQDVANVFMDDFSTYVDKLRKMIFEGSIEVDTILTQSNIDSMGLTPEQAFMLKREYVICKSVYKFGRIFHRDYMSKVKKSKFLADVKVSLEVENDPSMIKSIISDAKDCYEEIEDMIGTMGGTGMASFVKGGSNPCNNRSHRQWWPGNGSGEPRIPIAARKSATFCSKYKIGAIGAY